MSTRHDDDHGTLDLLEALAQMPDFPEPPVLPSRVPAAPKPAGPEVATICALMSGDPIHATDRQRIVTAILTDGREHDGLVDPNRVRARLTRVNADGSTDLVVYPRVLSAVYQGLAARGVLEFAAWIDNTDARGRNNGKPARSYRLTRLPEETP